MKEVKIFYIGYRTNICVGKFRMVFEDALYVSKARKSFSEYFCFSFTVLWFQYGVTKRLSQCGNIWSY